MAMAWCRIEEGTLLDLLAAEQTALALSKRPDVDRESRDLNREDVRRYYMRGVPGRV